MEYVKICRFSGVDESLLVRLSDTLPERLSSIGVRVVVSQVVLSIPSHTLDHRRGQYRAEPFLETLGSQVEDDMHVLGLVNLDLYVPDLNFIFGLAYRGGNAIVALPRLNPTFYGMRPDPELFELRILKEAVHELGHVFGLAHCTDRRCVMYFSNCLSDTDRKSETICPRCLRSLRTTREEHMFK